MATRTSNSRAANGELIKSLVEGIDIAMVTTVGKGGYMVSRPLSTQAASFDGERVWFFTEGDTPKADEIRRNSKVNLAYASASKNTYVSLVGDAAINRDRRRINQFWNPAMKTFFPKGKTDPNLVLIEVTVRSAEYWDGPGSMIGKAFSFIAATITGNDDLMAENRIIDMSTGRSRKPPSNDSSPRKNAAAKRKAAEPLTRTVKKKTATHASTGKGGVAKTPAKKAVASRAKRARAS